jgi:hypothetical protein
LREGSRVRPKTLTTRELNRALLARQGLLGRKRISVPRMIEKTGGLQTQEPRDAFISLAARIDRFTPAKLRAAAEAGEIVRGSFYRCTIHTVTAADFLASRAALADVIERDTANWRDRYVGLDKAAVVKAVKKLLADDQPRTARQIGEQLQEQFPKANREGLSHCARIHVPVVMAPGDERWGYSRPPKLAMAERFLGAKLLKDDAAAREAILLRGIAAIGPCTVGDLRTWSGLTGVKQSLEPLLPELREFRDEAGRVLHDLPSSPRPRAGTEAPVRFLGEFDNIFLSHDERSRIIDPAIAAEFTPGVNGRRLYTFLVDGFVGGAWRIETKRSRSLVRVQPFVKLTRGQRAELKTEAAALAALIEPDAADRDVEFLKS